MSHDLLQALAIFAAGLAAGTINAVVGSGTLITFPTLLAFGYPPVLANVSNNVGLVPGVASGVHGYRAELVGQRRRIIRLGSASVCGGLVGAILLLVLPAGAFKEIVPALIGIALVMIIFQPRLARRMAARQLARAAAPAGELGADGGTNGTSSTGGTGSTTGTGGTSTVRVVAPVAKETPVQIGGPVLWVLVFLSGVYGGYFGAAQGVLVIGLLGSFLDENLQRVTGAKNVLVAMVNGTAAVVFIALAHVSWTAVALLAAGSTVGGLLGARYGRRLPPAVLRLFVVAVGVISAVKLIFF